MTMRKATFSLKNTNTVLHVILRVTKYPITISGQGSEILKNEKNY